MAWEYDGPHSRVGFIASHFGLTTVHGHFRSVDVTVEVDEAEPTKSRVEATIDAASLTTDFERRDDAIKGESFLEVELYPTITFKSKRIDPRGDSRYAVIGDFTMHGVTRDLVLDTTYNGEVTDARGTTLRGLAGRAMIRWRDFGIKGHPTDPMNVAEEIQLVIDVELHQRD